jgi:hypothetical protein
MTKTNKPQITIHDVQTGEVIVRDANAEEIAQIELDAANAATFKAEAAAKATARQAILDRLGLTAEEAQLLLGGN